MLFRQMDVGWRNLQDFCQADIVQSWVCRNEGRNQREDTRFIGHEVEVVFFLILAKQIPNSTEVCLLIFEQDFEVTLVRMTVIYKRYVFRRIPTRYIINVN